MVASMDVVTKLKLCYQHHLNKKNIKYKNERIRRKITMNIYSFPKETVHNF